MRIVKTLRNVFPRVHPYFGPVPIYPCGQLELDVRLSQRRRLTRRATTAWPRSKPAAATTTATSTAPRFVQPNYVRKALG